MSQPFIGGIRIFGGTFAPAGWAFCDGSQMPISEYDALFTLIGTTYGGDGQSTFNLPNLSGRIPVCAGANPATGTNYQFGEMAGTESVTLTTQQIPVHTHTAWERSIRRPPTRRRTRSPRRCRSRQVRRRMARTRRRRGYSRRSHGRRQPAARQHAAVPRGESHHLAVRRLPPADIGARDG